LRRPERRRVPLGAAHGAALLGRIVEPRRAVEQGFHLRPRGQRAGELEHAHAAERADPAPGLEPAARDRERAHRLGVLRAQLDIGLRRALRAHTHACTSRNPASPWKNAMPGPSAYAEPSASTSARSRRSPQAPPIARETWPSDAARSGCGISAMTLPRALQSAATAASEPFGFSGKLSASAPSGRA